MAYLVTDISKDMEGPYLVKDFSTDMMDTYLVKDISTDMLMLLLPMRSWYSRCSLG